MFDILLATYDTVGIRFYWYFFRQGEHIQMKTSSYNGKDVTLCIAANISKWTFALIMKIFLFFTSHTTALFTHPLLKKKKIAICTFVGLHFFFCGER